MAEPTAQERMARRVSGRRAVLLGVAALLSIAAALAIAILLFGDFGSTEGRILGSTAVLSGYALLTLPAAMLQDQRRLPALAALGLVLALAGAALALMLIWRGSSSDDLGKTLSTVTAALLVTVQASALVLRPLGGEPAVRRALYAASVALVTVVAAMFAALLWAEIEDEGFVRVFAALVVLDGLLVALQPILGRARPQTRAYRLRVHAPPGEALELEVEARDAAAGAEQAIRRLEREGRRVRAVELLDEGVPRADRRRSADATRGGGMEDEPELQETENEWDELEGENVPGMTESPDESEPKEERRGDS